jgi:hypothetical protein
MVFVGIIAVENTLKCLEIHDLVYCTWA